MKTLPILPMLTTLILDETRLQTFIDANPQPKLSSISLLGTPLIQYEFLQLMCVIVFGDSISEVNGQILDDNTINIGKELRPRVQDYLKKGWIIYCYCPLCIVNPQNNQTINLTSTELKANQLSSAMPLPDLVSCPPFKFPTKSEVISESISGYYKAQSGESDNTKQNNRVTSRGIESNHRRSHRKKKHTHLWSVSNTMDNTSESDSNTMIVDTIVISSGDSSPNSDIFVFQSNPQTKQRKPTPQNNPQSVALQIDNKEPPRSPSHYKAPPVRKLSTTDAHESENKVPLTSNLKNQATSPSPNRKRLDYDAPPLSANLLPKAPPLKKTLDHPSDFQDEDDNNEPVNNSPTSTPRSKKKKKKSKKKNMISMPILSPKSPPPLPIPQSLEFEPASSSMQPSEALPATPTTLKPISPLVTPRPPEIKNVFPIDDKPEEEEQEKPKPEVKPKSPKKSAPKRKLHKKKKAKKSAKKKSSKSGKSDKSNKSQKQETKSSKSQSSYVDEGESYADEEEESYNSRKASENEEPQQSILDFGTLKIEPPSQEEQAKPKEKKRKSVSSEPELPDTPILDSPRKKRKRVRRTKTLIGGSRQKVRVSGHTEVFETDDDGYEDDDPPVFKKVNFFDLIGVDPDSGDEYLSQDESSHKEEEEIQGPDDLIAELRAEGRRMFYQMRTVETSTLEEMEKFVSSYVRSSLKKM